MRYGTLVSIVSLAAVFGAIGLQVVYPKLQLDIFYIVLVWVIAGFFIYRLPIMSRQVGQPRVSAAAPAALPSAASPLGGVAPPPGTSAGALGFCLYCGSMVDPGTALCPNCGRSLPLA
ncbi:MAG: zinc ribbon domain-containing protein [Thermoplasmata archaeon]|nr:zinc ribbon domain-containing protein [Thermoplasmata archaeon]